MKYQRFTTLGSKDIGIINSEFVTKTQFLYAAKKDGTWEKSHVPDFLSDKAGCELSFKLEVV